MPLANATILSGATLAATGGTAKTYSTAGEFIPNGRKMVDLSEKDARVRPSITCVNKPATLNSQTGQYSKGKRVFKLVKPKVLASGKIIFPLFEARIEDHPEMTQAEVDALLTEGAQMCFDADFLPFVRSGSTD